MIAVNQIHSMDNKTGEAVGVFKVIFTIDVLNEGVYQLFNGNNRGERSDSSHKNGRLGECG